MSLYVADRQVIVVGDGAAAEERAVRLAAAGARIERIAAADYLPDRSAGRIGDRLAGAFAVFAQADPELNARVAADARAAGALVYAHDLPDLSDLAMPALARRGPIALAISTDAAAPALARRLRELCQSLLDSGGDKLDALVAELERQRAALPSGARSGLYRIASRLGLHGRLDVAEPAGDDPADL